MRVLTEFEEICQRLKGARRAEEVFGDLGPLPEAGLQRAFGRLVQMVHPDRQPGAPEMAREAFERLMLWRERARERISRGTWGREEASREIAGLRGKYRVFEPGVAADYATLYRCQTERGEELVFQITRDPADNPLGLQQVRALQLLRGAGCAAYFPVLREAFVADDGTARRQTVIYATGGARHSLRDVRAAYPAGLDPRDAAWIFNRLLEALYHAHAVGLVYAAVVPAFAWMDIARHGLVLTEWGYSLEIGQEPRALSAAHEAWYPQEFLARALASPGVDIYMAARCLAELLGAQVVGQEVLPAGRKDVPPALLRFIRGCLLPAARRPQDAGALREEFGDLLRALFGKPAFRPLAMPA